MTIKYIRRYLECMHCQMETDLGYLVECGICIFTLCRRCGKQMKKKRKEDEGERYDLVPHGKTREQTPITPGVDKWGRT